MRYSEKTLQGWTAPLSDTEKQRVENTVNMIKSALKESNSLSAFEYEVFAQGSYANNTNVRINSDVDICVMLKSAFYGNYVEGKKGSDYGFGEGQISDDDYRAFVYKALCDKFDSQNVMRGNKSLKISSNSYHVNADVVPAFQYRNYKVIGSLNPSSFIEGIKYYATDGSEVINYPKVHIKNGTAKNNRTNYAYKKLVRIMKRIRNDMVDDGLVNKDIISSFLIECLVWNVPDSVIMRRSTWSATVLDTIHYLWNEINEGNHKEWREVSERLYLFRGRKWTDIDAKKFLVDAYNYVNG